MDPLESSAFFIKGRHAYSMMQGIFFNAH